LSKFPEPPPAADLAGITPEWTTLPRGTTLWRLYFRGGKHPTFWNTFRKYGPTSSRFDHHLVPPRLQDRGISYAAAHGPTCLAEVFQETRVIDRVAKDPWLAGFVLELPITLLDLTGSWPTRAGASMAINTGPRPRAQRWSRAIYEAYPNGRGLHFPSSMRGNLPAVALYERGLPALPPAPIFHRPLRDPALLPILKRVAWDLGYGLV
jgi:RES domain